MLLSMHLCQSCSFLGRWCRCLQETTIISSSRDKTASPCSTVLDAYLQPHIPRHGLGESNAHALDDSQQDGAADGAIPRSPVSSSDGQRAAGEEASDDAVVRVLLLPHALDGAVKGGEEASPHAKVATQHGRPHLDGGDCACASLAVRTVPEAFYAVPYRATDCLYFCSGWGGGFNKG